MNLPDADVLAEETVENFESALDEFKAIIGQWKKVKVRAALCIKQKLRDKDSSF